MHKFDKRMGHGWSKKLREAYYEKFGVNAFFEFFNSRLIRSMFVYAEDGKVIYVMQNLSVYYIGGLMRDSIKENRNLLREAIERDLSQLTITKEFINTQIKNDFYI